ncbi:hypothetical protein DFP72DRAFT_1043675 [Ephemerocybe angulata]|uniref:Uncharacterized protein n=1 Tax=Ephemerocybe angulata TaxID=980116 RepID=A0A8H6I6A1_9AGAR|nr:hypothetical protein DFP72DRAFT_1043675 [Tulosesus angulatus]
MPLSWVTACVFARAQGLGLDPRKLPLYLLPSNPMVFSPAISLPSAKGMKSQMNERILGGALTMWLRSQLFVAMVTSEERPVVSVEFTMIERMTLMPSFTPHHEFSTPF